jgi:hypothetical protein
MVCVYLRVCAAGKKKISTTKAATVYPLVVRGSGDATYAKLFLGVGFLFVLD